MYKRPGSYRDHLTTQATQFWSQLCLPVPCVPPDPHQQGGHERTYLRLVATPFGSLWLLLVASVVAATPLYCKLTEWGVHLLCKSWDLNTLLIWITLFIIFGLFVVGVWQQFQLKGRWMKESRVRFDSDKTGRCLSFSGVPPNPSNSSRDLSFYYL